MTPARKAVSRVSSSRSGEEEHPYVMTVDLAVLEALGINLYSNAAAVLSELVANAYDADATHVKIDWKSDGAKVVVVDNGCGMTVADINDRFLKVGYKKRVAEGTVSKKWERPFMGRKGIGKLSVFSIAEHVSVYSKKGRQSNGLKIEAKGLEKAIHNDRPYFPEPLAVPAEYDKPGTTIVLEKLKSKRASLTANALRKRLARRFDVLDTTSQADGGFAIEVNTKRITWADRQELKKLEFIWEFKRKSLPSIALPADVTRFILPSDTVDAGKGWKVSGWIGTAKKPTDLTSDEEAGSLKNIIVLARKRPIQEGIVEKLDFSRIFGNYVTGQIEADFLDLDGEYEDIATSDRQRMIEDDERVVALQKFLREAFLRAAEEWSKARPKKVAEDVLDKFPKLKEWVEKRPQWQRESARTMIGTIASLELEKNAPEDRAALFRSGVLAFERVGLRKAADDLEKLSGVTAIELLPLLGAQDAYEAGLWVDILRSRVQAISQFKNLTRVNEKEKVLQRHLFDHLWLLDASWERATTDSRMEEDLRKIEPAFRAKDTDGKEIKGRIDIRYATASGRHVIVELKRYSVNDNVEVLAEQGLKYYNGLRSLLAQQRRTDLDIEVIFVLGKSPKTPGAGRLTSDEFIERRLDPVNGRYVLYDQLIANAMRQYEDYLNASDKARELEELLGTLKDMNGD
jgi:Histidine kinase-, DNA gyrase B-, and HSP90-like ATPase